MAGISEKAISSLESSLGKENVYVDMPHRAIRAAVPAPFPIVHWKKHIPDIVVLPKTTDEVVDIVKIANEYKIPIVPRAGGSGLCDGALPLKGGILLDIKRMNEIIEIDEMNRCVTIQPGVNMMELNKVLGRIGLWYSDDPASYCSATIGGRIGTGGWSLQGGSWGHVRDLVLSMEVVLPTGKVVRVGEGGGRKIRHSSVGYRLKELFMGAQGTLGITTEATLHVFLKPEAESPQFFGFQSFEESWHAIREFENLGLKTLTAVVIFSPEKIEFLRRDDEAYMPQPKHVVSAVLILLHGTEVEVAAAQEKVWETATRLNAHYLGDEIAKYDWNSRHDRYHITYHGRNAAGEVRMLGWHCEDAGINYSELPNIRKKWMEIANRYQAEYDGIFDNWGIFMYSSGAFGKQGDMLCEVDIGVAELELTPEQWQAFIKMKSEFAQASLDCGGTISAAHGGTRPGDVELSCYKELGEGAYDLMKQIKVMLDPNNIMNPGKYLLDQAYK